jgi:protein-S-isoprenylcysteine O-methyltransferase Ste14
LNNRWEPITLRATDFEFRNRFWIIMFVYVAAFMAYNLDPVNAGATAAGWLLGHPVNFAVPGDRHLMQPVFAFAASLTVLAAWIRTWAAAYLQSEVVHDSNLRLEGLVADGPYRYLRNPLYLGGNFLSAGFGILASRLGFLVLVAGLGFFYYRLIFREEAELLAAQGEPYRRFTEKVPRLLPSLFPRLPSSGAQPRWGQAFLGEAPLWMMACSVAAFAATLNSTLLYSIIAFAVAGYGIRQYLSSRRNRVHPPEPLA